MAIKWKEVFKFLSGLTFASSLIGFYLYFSNVSMPVPFLGYIAPPWMFGAKAVVHLALFGAFFYYGYMKK